VIQLENISFDHCIKCTICTVYCPVARVTHLFPGPKHSGPDAERLRIKTPELVDASLKYCTNCKRCEISCPSDVKIADIIQEAKWKYLKKRFRIRDYFLSRTDLLGSVATSTSWFVNFFTRLFLVKFFLDKLLKIPSGRRFPQYERGTFRRWFRKKAGDQSSFDERVVYFHGCFVNYNDHQLGRDLLTVLNAMNIGVLLANEKCCGVPLIANAYLEKARRNGQHNIRSLEQASDHGGIPIVATSTSCTFALKYEYQNLLALDNSRIINNIEYIMKYLYSQFERGNIPEMKPVGMRVAYHAPCHLERMGGVIYTIEVLKRIPGLDLVLLYSECCGIAGTYGFKSESYEISQDVGQDLFRKIERADPEIVITDCETCKLQIEMNTPYSVMHPVNVLSMALKEGK
jgi:glycerol-3-phosphate dehydrogenase subunit C